MLNALHLTWSSAGILNFMKFLLSGSLVITVVSGGLETFKIYNISFFGSTGVCSMIVGLFRLAWFICLEFVFDTKKVILKLHGIEFSVLFFLRGFGKLKKKNSKKNFKFFFLKYPSTDFQIRAIHRKTA